MAVKSVLTRFAVSIAAIVMGSASLGQAVSPDQLARLLSLSGGTQGAGYVVAPDWSEDLGFSVRGHAGVLLGDATGLGFVGRHGANVTEGLVNLGFDLAGRNMLVFSAGRLRENLVIGDGTSRAWVGQQAYGVALTGGEFGARAYLTQSESGNGFVGARSFGAEVSSRMRLSNRMMLDGTVGYQQIDWNDGGAREGGVTGGLGLGVVATDNLFVSAFADYGLSEAEYGVGAQWRAGVGTLDLGIGAVTGMTGDVGDDRRLSVVFSLPLGGLVQRSTSSATDNEVATHTSLLHAVMTRPSYLPERVIVKTDAAGQSANTCEYNWQFLSGSGSGPGFLDVQYVDIGQAFGLPASGVIDSIMTRVVNADVFIDDVYVGDYTNIQDLGTSIVVYFDPLVDIPPEGTYAFRVELTSASGDRVVCWENSYVDGNFESGPP